MVEVMKLLSVKHVRKPRGNNKAYSYQRKVPKELQKYDRGRNNKPRKAIEEPLGLTEAEAVEAYPAVHKKWEAKLKHYKALFRNGTAPSHRHERLKETIAKWHLDADGLADARGEDFYYDHWFDEEIRPYIDDAKLAKAHGEENRHGLVVTKAVYLDCLDAEEWKKELLEDVWEYIDTKDASSLDDVFDFYRQYLHVKKGTPQQKKKRLEQIDLLQRYMHDGIGNILVRKFKKDHAKALQQFLLNGEKEHGGARAVSTVRKYWKIYVSAWNLYANENEITAEPFKKLSWPASPSRGEGDERSLPDDLLSKCIEQVVEGRTHHRTKQVWLLLLLTGARLSEICNLERHEIFLDDEVPHIKIREVWEEGEVVKSVKTAGSQRAIPLTPLAQMILRQALRETNQGQIFIGWFNNSNAASASLGKIVKKFRDGNKSYVTHSLRHNMRDRLDEHEPNQRTKMAIQGWSQDIGEAGKYGAVSLELKQAALLKANEKVERKVNQAIERLKPEWSETLEYPANR
jgi:integrase